MIAQMLTLRHIAARFDDLVVNGRLATGTIESLQRLSELDLLSSEQSLRLINHYRALRGVEANLRLMDTPARHELPHEDSRMRDLAFLMNESDPRMVRVIVEQARAGNRELFETLFSSPRTDT